ncbi:MAG: AraC family transcriptional regulator [Brumimicrobium sp.]
MKNQIHIDRDFGWFIGGFDNNQKHSHYAIQLNIPLDNRIIIKTSETTVETENPILIKSNVVHQIVSDSRHFLLLINPASTIGHFWSHLVGKEIQEVNLRPTKDLKSALMDKGQKQIPTKELNSIIEAHDCFCNLAIHKGDDRINKALSYLRNHSERIVPIEEVANYSHLSSSRFLHLFKEQTGITYRRAQLWNKLTKSISHFGEMSLTEIAYQNGFSDSAHFSREFKVNFGFTPRDFLKISQFIQV